MWSPTGAENGTFDHRLFLVHWGASVGGPSDFRPACGTRVYEPEPVRPRRRRGGAEAAASTAGGVRTAARARRRKDGAGGEVGY